MDKAMWSEYTKSYAEAAGSMSEIIKLDGKVAVVTGGAGTLGFLVANRLAEAGASVVLIDIDEERGAYALEALGEMGKQNIRFVKADITKYEEAEAAMKYTVDQFGRLDICVNSAARWSFFPSLDMPEEEWNKVIDLDLTGTFHVLKSAGRVMRELGNGGKMVAVGSVAAINCEPPVGVLNHYAAAKAGAVAFTKSLARECKKYNINCNMVLPGSMNSLGNQIYQLGLVDHIEELVSVKIPGGDNPDEVARVIFMMCTKISDYMYGASLVADGGAHIFIQD